jgi:peptide/nickel transport system permease protein
MKTRRRVRVRASLALGILLVLAFAAVALAAPLLAPPQNEDPYVIPRDGFSTVPKPPRPGHPLGTLEGQSDIFYGLVWGTRIAFRLGLIITVGRALIGVLLGLISGYYGGLTDATLMRFTDAFLAFPLMAAAMVMLVIFGDILNALPSGGRLLMSSRIEMVLIVSLILFGWMAYARLIRGNVLAEREKEYVQAAHAVGAKNGRIMLRHLLPNVTHGLFVLLASDVGAMVVFVAAFSFMGFGATSQSELRADWGQMLSLARNWIIGGSPGNPFEFWYTYVPVSAAIVLFSIGWNLVGDGLRDALDPRLR